LPITLLTSKLRSSNPLWNDNATNEDRRQTAGESWQKLRILSINSEIIGRKFTKLHNMSPDYCHWIFWKQIYDRPIRCRTLKQRVKVVPRDVCIHLHLPNWSGCHSNVPWGTARGVDPYGTGDMSPQYLWRGDIHVMSPNILDFVARLISSSNSNCCLARSANLPIGLYILPSVISSFFTMSKAISVSTGPIFTIFSPNGRYLRNFS